MAGNLDADILKFIEQSDDIEFGLTKISSFDDDSGIVVKFDQNPIFLMGYGPSSVLANSPCRTELLPKVNCAALAIGSGVWMNDVNLLKFEEMGKVLSFPLSSAVSKSRAIRLFVEISKIHFVKYEPDCFSAKALEILVQNKEEHRVQTKEKSKLSVPESSNNTDSSMKPTSIDGSTVEVFPPSYEDVINKQGEGRGQMFQEPNDTKTYVTAGLAAAAGAALTGLAAFGIYKLTKTTGRSASSLASGARSGTYLVKSTAVVHQTVKKL